LPVLQSLMASGFPDIGTSGAGVVAGKCDFDGVGNGCGRKKHKCFNCF